MSTDTDTEAAGPVSELARLGRLRLDAKAALEEITAQLRAAALIEAESRSESAVAVEAMIDRGTLREWRASQVPSEGVDTRPSRVWQHERNLNAVSICDRLADHAETITGTRPKVTSAWLNAARLLIDEVGNGKSAIGTLRQVTDHPFWRGRITNPVQLRKHWPQILLSLREEREQRQAESEQP